MIKVEVIFLLFFFAFGLSLAASQSSTQQPHAAESFNVSYIQVCLENSFLDISLLDCLVLFLCIWNLRLSSFLSFFCNNKDEERGKLFLHGGYIYELFVSQIYKGSDQYFFRGCLWYPGLVFPKLGLSINYCF